jgi:hypothetical protein
MELGQLVQEFATWVAAQSSAMEKGDSVVGNRFAKRYISAFEKLRAAGDVGRNALSDLLDDDRPEVRSMAACFLLRHSGERARRVLEVEAQGHGITAFGAAQCLERWKEGTWSLDPE